MTFTSEVRGSCLQVQSQDIQVGWDTGQARGLEGSWGQDLGPALHSPQGTHLERKQGGTKMGKANQSTEKEGSGCGGQRRGHPPATTCCLWP